MRHKHNHAINSQPLSLAILGLRHEAAGSHDTTAIQVWAHLLHHYVTQEGQAPASDERLTRLWQAGQADPAHPWTREMLATHADMSQEHLRQLCHQQLGRAPMQQVLRLRMLHAESLLLRTGLSIEAIAHQAGYSNAFAFSTAFGRHFGDTPSHDRRRTRQVR